MEQINHTITARRGERGNVLFLILIAVALFAALSYAVTSSSRSGGGSADGESTLVNSAQITQYPASVRTALVRMTIGGVDATQVEFDPPVDFASLTDTDPGAGTKYSYGVFHPDGGGATYVTTPPDTMDAGTQGTWLFNSDYQVTNIGTSPATNAGNDIIAFLPGTALSVCKRLNTELGITTTTAGWTDTDANGVPGAGVLIANIPTAAMNQDGGNQGIDPYAATRVIGGVFTGQPYGCFDADDATAGSASGDLVYYHVLLER